VTATSADCWLLAQQRFCDAQERTRRHFHGSYSSLNANQQGWHQLLPPIDCPRRMGHTAAARGLSPSRRVIESHPGDEGLEE
jgi:hypothetical protein